MNTDNVPDVPAWIQAITSVFTLVAAIVAGYFAGRAAKYTKKQAEASDAQVRIAQHTLEVTRAQAAIAEEHSNHQLEIGRETLAIAQQEAKAAQAAAEQQVDEAKAAYRRYEESKLDAIAPAVLAKVRRRGWFLQTNELYEDDPSMWTGWVTLSEPRYIDDAKREGIVFRIILDVTLSNVSEHIARVDIVDAPNANLHTARLNEPIVVPPHEERHFTWMRDLTPSVLATEEDINDAKNCYFQLTLWVRDLGMNVRDTYKFNSDLRLFSRDGSRLLVMPVPEHDWSENVAQPLQDRQYERLERDRSATANFSGSGNLTSSITKGPS